MIYAQTEIRPKEWDTKNSVGFWDPDGSPNLGQVTIPSGSQQKEKNLPGCEFCRSRWS